MAMQYPHYVYPFSGHSLLAYPVDSSLEGNIKHCICASTERVADNNYHR